MRNTFLVSFLVSASLSVVAAPSTFAAPVVGGTVVPAHAWPDAVAVLAPRAACTGTLIAPDVVLTAGHCIGVHPVEVIVDTIDYGSSGGERIAVASAHAYPSWDTTYDVGVLVLASPAKAKPRAIAATCTLDTALYDGAAVRLVGFGLTTASGTGDNSRLHQAVVPVTDAACSDPLACQPRVAPDGEFMAGGGGKDSCFGDSGGPVYVEAARTGSAALAGVVSRGMGEPGAPCGGGGVYVRADKVVPWIEKTTGRTITRTTCAGKGDEVAAGDAGAPDAGGCDASGAGAVGGLGGGLLALAMALRRGRLPRRRRA